MDYKIRKKESKDCAEVAHVVTVAWNETYGGIVPDEFLNKVDGLADTERCSRSELIREALRNYMRRASKQQLENASRNAEILEDILG